MNPILYINFWYCKSSYAELLSKESILQGLSHAVRWLAQRWCQWQLVNHISILKFSGGFEMLKSWWEVIGFTHHENIPRRSEPICMYNTVGYVQSLVRCQNKLFYRAQDLNKLVTYTSWFSFLHLCHVLGKVIHLWLCWYRIKTLSEIISILGSSFELLFYLYWINYVRLR